MGYSKNKMTKIEAYLEKRFKIDASYYIRGTFWNTISQAIVLIGGLTTTVIFARVLSATDYGTYKYIIAAAALLTSFSLAGLGQSVLQTAAKKYYNFYTETLSLSLLYGMGITTVSFVASLYYAYQHNYLLACGFALIAITQPLTNTYQNIFAFLLGSKRLQDATRAQLFNVVTMSVLSIATILITHDILVLLIVYFVSNFITFFLTHLYYRPKNSEPTPPEIYDKFISFAKNTSVRNFISDVAFRLDTILIFTQLGAAELAIYTIANLLPEQVKGFFKNIGVLLLPKYAERTNIDSKKGIIKKSIQLLIFSIFVTISYILISPILYLILFPNYQSTVILTQLVSLAIPTMIAVIPLSILQSQLKESALYKLNLSNALIAIFLTIILIFPYGLVGVIVARILSRYINLMQTYYYLFRSM